MAKRNANQLEAQLISLAGTFIYLKKIRAVLDRKPLIPRHMEGVMASVKQELGTLDTSFDGVEEATRVVSENLLLDWLHGLGMSIGGSLTCRVGGVGIEVSGRIESLSLFPELMEGNWRAVEVLLVPASVMQWGESTNLDKIEKASSDTKRLFQSRAHVVNGRAETAVAVRVPIQELQRERLSRRTESIQIS
ncbi:short-chain dehydrogenase [Novimethylophilus kurashikiensis]|uniref:Short-chain dehydrogenase n=1 Tax=Novimethylophilus kurashikiensis TaxID=1825523 RepID=A0A2R5F7Q5_9PROT|nr:hypothetical protein [Novimethylophilus kurashikiensis]GBG14246.1 short-chain dehydrogenase [Novimethylophilus kurashikiensis]